MRRGTDLRVMYSTDTTCRKQFTLQDVSVGLLRSVGGTRQLVRGQGAPTKLYG
jgi:hypothetical protein